jgi:2-polyprenyl-3-methyl-5-hydroxy-6-metoxy-1,4-benzoquinol methylase
MHRPLLPDFNRRYFAPELMDDPNGSETALFSALRQFSVVNRLFSRTRAAFRRHIFPDIRARGLREVTVLDGGAGGGDFILWCSRFLQRSGISARIIGLDIDPRVVRFLRSRCGETPGIEIIEGSVLDIAAVPGPIDYVFSNHLLHHFEDQQIPPLLAEVFATARCGVLINDLARGPGAYLGFMCFAGIFMPGGFTLQDGLLSIRKGFTKAELRKYARAAGLGAKTRILSSGPGHLLLVALQDRRTPLPSAAARPRC